jgi:hypothetical protein
MDHFTQEDPIGLSGGMNLYGFAAGDPITFSDPFGLAGCKRDEPCESPIAQMWRQAMDNIKSSLIDVGVAVAEAGAGLVNAVTGLGDLYTAAGLNPAASGSDRAMAAGSLIFTAGSAAGGRVAANLARTLKGAQGADVAVSRVGKFFRASWEVAGESGGQSRTVWVKDIAPDGRTVRMYHDSYDRAGIFQHRKIKFP